MRSAKIGTSHCLNYVLRPALTKLCPGDLSCPGWIGCTDRLGHSLMAANRMSHPQGLTPLGNESLPNSPSRRHVAGRLFFQSLDESTTENRNAMSPNNAERPLDRGVANGNQADCPGIFAVNPLPDLESRHSIGAEAEGHSSQCDRRAIASQCTPIRALPGRRAAAKPHLHSSRACPLSTVVRTNWRCPFCPIRALLLGFFIPNGPTLVRQVSLLDHEIVARHVDLTVIDNWLRALGCQATTTQCPRYLPMSDAARFGPLFQLVHRVLAS